MTLPRVVRGLTLAVLAILGARARAAAQGPPLEVTRVGAPAFIVDSSGRVTPVFRIVNRAAIGRVGRVSYTLPAEWRLLAADTSVLIAAHDSELAFVPIWVPPSARAGGSMLRYSVAVDGSTSIARDSVLVTVPERRQLSAEPLPAPRFIPAGSPYTVSFAVRNAGNARTKVRLALTGSNGIDARLVDSAVVYLEPAEVRTVRAEVETSARLSSEVRHRVALTATSEGPPAVRAAAMTLVEIIPRRTGSSPRFRVVPAELLLRAGDQSNSYTAELRGGGLLGSSSKTRLDFLARGPNPSGSFLGQQDEYRLRLTSPLYRLELGDQVNTTSRLSETGRATFGAGAGLAIGSLELGAYTRKDRRSFEFTREQQQGGSADLWLSSLARVGASAFTRTGIDAATAWTSRSHFGEYRGLTLDGEYARSSATYGVGSAYSVAATGEYARLFYDFRRESADTGFANYWRGTANTYASLSVRPIGNLTFLGRYTDYAAVRIPSLSFTSDRGQHGVEGGLAYGRLAGATYRDVREDGLTFAPSPGRRSRSVQEFIGLPVPIAFLRVEAEEGYAVYDGAPTDHVPFTRVGLRASGGLGSQRFSGNIERLTGTAPFTISAQDRIAGNVSASLRLGPLTRLNVDVNTFRYAGPFPQTFSTLDVGIGRELPFGQRVALHSRALAYSPAVATRRTMQQLEYAMPIGVPIALSEDAGTVDVIIIDDVTGRPASNVLLRLGNESRITDANGHARFIGLSEGSYYLEPDRGTLAPGRVVMPATPLPLTLHAAEKRRVELHVMGGARVTGSVRLQDYGPRPRIDAPDTLVDAGPATGIVVGMANGDTVRAPVDADGRFNFTDLHPGKWTLFVVAANVPPFYHLDRDRVPLDLVPGTPQDVEIKVVPEKRDVRFLVSAELTPTLVTGDTTRPTSPTVTAHHTYTVGHPSETLMQIAGAMYGNRSLWPKIWLANRGLLPRPEALKLGQRLVVPDSAALTPDEIAARDEYLTGRAVPPALRIPVSDTSWQAPVVTRWYTVGPGEGLFAIARNVYDDASLWPKLWYANLDQLRTPEQVRLGQRLRVPDKAPLTPPEIATRDAYLRGRKP